MFLRTETIAQKLFIGKSQIMSFARNETSELWRKFMPERKEVKHTIGTELYSMEVYPPGYFSNFDPGRQFIKWAAVEVTGFDDVPKEMETLVVPAGLYAVFLHSGPAANGPKTYQYIFQTLLPASGYLVDDRPHFAVMGDKYQPNSVVSEEEIWIPVQPS